MVIILIYQKRKQRLREIKAMYSTVAGSYLPFFHLSLNLVLQRVPIALVASQTNKPPTHTKEEAVHRPYLHFLIRLLSLTGP